MVFEELKEDLMEAEADMRSYIKHSDEYLRLKIFKVIMLHVTGLSKFVLIGASFTFALLFLSLAACLALSEALNNYFIGFIIVGLFYILIGTLLYAFREKLNAPILKKSSKYYFE
ncbi:hypothetical protein [Pseudozobellia thermophila]|uniref:Holin-X, holin superfamily III n=1 Tax=Pseudozobellia thermophila TaxID=192903 RepID=A0A1M6IK15_9FLAO|nr:hypothetical protein [Pseudozobellia thermophila]SHJ34832.1 hypothetical protein SAMN04488513_10416 [Pseudozobellia thermophila]